MRREYADAGAGGYRTRPRSATCAGNSHDNRPHGREAFAVDINPVRPGDKDALRAVWKVETAAHRVDLPMLPANPVQDIVNEPPIQKSRVRKRWLAFDGDRPVGAARLVLPQLDNRHVGELWIVVHPEVRRRGIGRALLDVAVRSMREDGRTTVMAEVPEPLVDALRSDSTGHRSPAAAFAAAAGAQAALAEMCRVLDLDSLDDAHLAALETEARSRSRGYELVQWVGPAPEEFLPDLARLTSRMSTDAPMGGLHWEQEAWDPERYREAEAEPIAMGRQWVTTAARHCGTGRLAAYTDMGWSTHDPEPAFQWTTIVEREHRGNRLGMLVKVGNLHLLRREQPAVRRIFTWNADSNEHMLAINKAMGFRPVAKWTEWQLDLA